MFENQKQNMSSAFRMSKKKIYLPPPTEEEIKEELEKSIMGVSFKQIGQSNIRESLGVIKNTPRKMSTHLKDDKITDRIFDEFFIIGLDKNSLSQDDIRRMRILPPQNLYMLN
jgi:hypothetical protein